VARNTKSVLGGACRYFMQRILGRASTAQYEPASIGGLEPRR